MNFKIFTFGCKVNQYETEYIRKIMCESGYISTEIDSEAQIFIVNSQIHRQTTTKLPQKYNCSLWMYVSGISTEI